MKIALIWDGDRYRIEGDVPSSQMPDILTIELDNAGEVKTVVPIWKTEIDFQTRVEIEDALSKLKAHGKAARKAS